MLYQKGALVGTNTSGKYTMVKTLHYVTNEPNAHTFTIETQYM
jgi:ABC-type sugar transport system ATPase subunit